MIQLCSKDKEKVYQAIRSGNIDAADMALPNLIDDIVLTMKKHGLLDMLSYALPDKRRLWLSLQNSKLKPVLQMSLLLSMMLSFWPNLDGMYGIVSGISMKGFFLKASCVSCF